MATRAAAITELYSRKTEKGLVSYEALSFAHHGVAPRGASLAFRDSRLVSLPRPIVVVGQEAGVDQHFGVATHGVVTERDRRRNAIPERAVDPYLLTIEPDLVMVRTGVSTNDESALQAIGMEQRLARANAIEPDEGARYGGPSGRSARAADHA